MSNLGFQSINWNQDANFSQGTAFAGVSLNALSSSSYKIELPISLHKSSFLSSAIKDNIVIRIFFKKSVIVQKPALSFNFGGQVLDSQIAISDLKIYLRCIELTNTEVVSFYKQPKITYPFSKIMSYKYILNSFPQNQEINVLLNGFNSVATGAFILTTHPCAG